MNFNSGALNRPNSNLSLDILLGKDETLEISDVLVGGELFFLAIHVSLKLMIYYIHEIDGPVTADATDFHTAMERKLRMF